MRMVAPDGPVYQAGTLSGNPLATAGGLAALIYLRDNPSVYDTLEERGQQLEEGVLALIAKEGFPLYWTRVGSMASLFFSGDLVKDWPTASNSDRDAFNRFFWGMLDRGFYLAPSPFEALFLSSAHTEGDVQATLHAAGEILGDVFNG